MGTLWCFGPRVMSSEGFGLSMLNAAKHGFWVCKQGPYCHVSEPDTDNSYR